MQCWACYFKKVISSYYLWEVTSNMSYIIIKETNYQGKQLLLLFFFLMFKYVK